MSFFCLACCSFAVPCCKKKENEEVVLDSREPRNTGWRFVSIVGLLTRFAERQLAIRISRKSIAQASWKSWGPNEIPEFVIVHFGVREVVEAIKHLASSKHTICAASQLSVSTRSDSGHNENLDSSELCCVPIVELRKVWN